MEKKKTSIQTLLKPTLKNHYLISNPQAYSTCGEEKAIQLKEEGFRCLKIKISPNIKLTPSFLKFCSNFKLRLDGNSSFRESSFQAYFQNWSPQLIKCIEYVEDPLPFNFQVWKRLQEKMNIPFALDRMPSASVSVFHEKKHFPCFKHLVLKPAQQNTKQLLKDIALPYRIPFTFSCYMDHPIGQVHAAIETCEGKKLLPKLHNPTAGLLGHLIYKKNSFSELLSVKNTCLQVEPDGYGIGFTSLLKKLPWKDLNTSIVMPFEFSDKNETFSL